MVHQPHPHAKFTASHTILSARAVTVSTASTILFENNIFILNQMSEVPKYGKRTTNVVTSNERAVNPTHFNHVSPPSFVHLPLPPTPPSSPPHSLPLYKHVGYTRPNCTRGRCTPDSMFQDFRATGVWRILAAENCAAGREAGVPGDYSCIMKVETADEVGGGEGGGCCATGEKLVCVSGKGEGSGAASR